MSAGRNEPCPCGSGQKYKHCCAGKKERSAQSIWTSVAVGLVLLGGLLFAGVTFFGDEEPSREADGVVDGRVWSEEHGHWHDAP